MSAQVDDIRRESLISRKWNFHKTFLSDYPDGILVTGANSFLGVHIVKALLAKGINRVHSLLRAPSKAEALAKMQQACRNWGLEEINPGDVQIHLGDVSQNMMGMSHSEYKSLTGKTGSVIHLAMTPLYHLPYEHFKRVWVPELERMIAFCGDSKHPKTLHYSSSFNANFFVTDEDFRALNANAWQSGYAGFKWVAGKALENAFEQNLRGAIYDIPLVLGTEEKGICPKHYSIWMILDIFLKTGYYFPFNFRVIPVDVLADIMIYNILEEREGRGTCTVRPFLGEPVTDGLFSRTVSSLLGLVPGDLETVRGLCQNKLRFDFMIPGNFYELLDKVNKLEAVFPAGYPGENLPSLPTVFLSNLNQILVKKTDKVILK